MGPDGRPGWPPNGGWDTHHPDGTQTPASNDGFHPTRDGEDPGQRPDDAEARIYDPPYDPPPARTEIKFEDEPDFDNWPEGAPGVRVEPSNEPFVRWNRPDDSEFSSPAPDDPANPETNPLRNGETFSSRDNPPESELRPKTKYTTPRATFYTNSEGRIEWVEAHPGRQGDPNPELNNPAPNAKYRVADNWTFQTNSKGETSAMTGTPHYKNNPNDPVSQSTHYYRDENAQDRVGQRGYDAYRGTEWEHVNWDGGHMAAHESGGPGEEINQFPQIRGSNQGHYEDGYTYKASWRALEAYLSRTAKTPGCSVDQIQVKLHPDNSTVPETATYRWTETRNGVTKTYEMVFPNDPAKVNFGRPRR
ncbi:hypothetical protein [Saccharopolyspora hordei]|uniref:DNA/RNA non-specific endonuclease n=1 Tax=Saccharopolyspora hordei TaxID=1838 RepID=A0A853AU35_9PSEU|nr:hypothetical protein [Saccharopolyspora hordei]NYI86151.1 hypothetical protein [Saccharopolyspora hordei]